LPHVERVDDWLAQLAASATPTLLVGGVRDSLLEPGWMANIAAVATGCVAVELDCKHAPNIDQIAPLLDVVLPFLAAH
jgi:pimeloyl-ACP methyl ester carboxylesterase